MRRLLKLSYNPKDHEVKVRYSSETPDKRVEVMSLRSPEEPAPALVDALQALEPFVRALCELPDEPPGEERPITVRGVSINRGSSTGITITGLRKLYHLMTPLVLNTPYTTEFGAACQAVLDALEAQALAYIDGERAQQTLGLEGGSGS